eukprot:Rhum_TRINITY_DN22915_c0_g1::Rhum_TRINITY_DN22915_c0_g1_i1::g.176448::m.176448
MLHAVGREPPPTLSVHLREVRGVLRHHFLGHGTPRAARAAHGLVGGLGPTRLDGVEEEVVVRGRDERARVARVRRRVVVLPHDVEPERRHNVPQLLHRQHHRRAACPRALEEQRAEVQPVSAGRQRVVDCFDVLEDVLPGVEEVAGHDGVPPLPVPRLAVDLREVAGNHAEVAAAGALCADERTHVRQAHFTQHVGAAHQTRHLVQVRVHPELPRRGTPVEDEVRRHQHVQRQLVPLHAEAPLPDLVREAAQAGPRHQDADAAAVHLVAGEGGLELRQQRRVALVAFLGAVGGPVAHEMLQHAAHALHVAFAGRDLLRGAGAVVHLLLVEEERVLVDLGQVAHEVVVLRHAALHGRKLAVHLRQQLLEARLKRAVAGLHAVDLRDGVALVVQERRLDGKEVALLHISLVHCARLVEHLCPMKYRYCSFY